MNTYDAVAQAILNKLNTVSQLNLVVDGEKPNLGKYPAAVVSANSHNNQFKTLDSNKRAFGFTINIYCPTDVAKYPDYESVIRQAVDAVIIAIEHDVTLGGACDYATPSMGKWGYGIKEVACRVCSITLTAIGHNIR